MRRRLGRRALLRGTVAGGLAVQLGLPTLEAMLNSHGTAYAQGAVLPRRFGVFFLGNGRGVQADRWNPVQSGKDWELSPLLAPLAPVKEYVSVVSGMHARLEQSFRGHHQGVAAIMTGYDYIAQDAANAPYRSTLARPTIDQRVAAAVGDATPFRSLELGLTRAIVNGEGTTLQHLSHSGPDSGNPAETDPLRVYERLFAEKPQEASMVGERLRALRASVLDSVTDDLNSLKTRVSSADRVRLEQHADSIRAIERRLLSTPQLGGACQSPEEPPQRASQEGEPIAERMEAMSDLLAMALACDMTRAFTIQFTGSVGGTVFWQVGADRGHHSLSHDGDATQGVMERITIFAMEQLAVLLKKLRETPDGAGNLLDSLALLATSDHSDGAAHSVEDFPVVVVGKAGGALTHPGVHYAASNEHTNRVLLTLLRASGVTIDNIGEGIAYTDQGCSALEA